MEQTTQSDATTETTSDGVRTLATEECWRLVSAQSFGRLAVRVAEGVDVFPVNFLVYERAIYFRSAPGSKLSAVTREPLVAFEVDGLAAHRVWSVVIRGEAKRVGDEDEIWDSGVVDLRTWHPSDKFNYVRIHPSMVSGRSFEKE